MKLYFIYSNSIIDYWFLISNIAIKFILIMLLNGIINSVKIEKSQQHSYLLKFPLWLVLFCWIIQNVVSYNDSNCDKIYFLLCYFIRSPYRNSINKNFVSIVLKLKQLTMKNESGQGLKSSNKILPELSFSTRL